MLPIKKAYKVAKPKIKNELTIDEINYILKEVMKIVFTKPRFLTTEILQKMKDDASNFPDETLNEIIKRSIVNSERNGDKNPEKTGSMNATKMIEKRIDRILATLRIGGLIETEKLPKNADKKTLKEKKIGKKVGTQDINKISSSLKKQLSKRYAQDDLLQEMLDKDPELIENPQERARVKRYQESDVSYIEDLLIELATLKAKGIYNAANDRSLEILKVYKKYADSNNETTNKFEHRLGEFGKDVANEFAEADDTKENRLLPSDKKIVQANRKGLLDDVHGIISFTPEEAKLANLQLQKLIDSVNRSDLADSEKYTYLRKLKSALESVELFS